MGFLMGCGSYYDWTEECRKTGCSKCSVLTFSGIPPKDCSCPAQPAGLMFTAVRSETCVIHGRCRCVNGPMRWDDHREANCWDRKWHPNCPLFAHVEGQ